MVQIRTSDVGISPNGTVVVYVPPNTTAIPRGYNVVNGTYNQVTAGDEVTLTGLLQIANGSGIFDATGPVTYRTVTIIAPTQQEEE